MNNRPNPNKPVAPGKTQEQIDADRVAAEAEVSRRSDRLGAPYSTPGTPGTPVGQSPTKTTVPYPPGSGTPTTQNPNQTQIDADRRQAEEDAQRHRDERADNDRMGDESLRHRKDKAAAEAATHAGKPVIDANKAAGDAKAVADAKAHAEANKNR